MHLSAHFKLHEMTKSQIATRLGLSNQPNCVQKAALTDLCQNILEPVRAHFGVPIIPSSGFRCQALNAAIGGRANSQHCRGEAVDFEVIGIANRCLADWISVMLDFDQLILEYPSPKNVNAGWVHVSYKKGRNRNQTLTKTQTGIFHGISAF